VNALSGREASIFACVVDTIVAPEPLLPPVRETDAAAFLDRWLARSPRLNRIGLRALLHAAELCPRALGMRARLRRLPEADRVRVLEALERHRSPQVRSVLRLVKQIACLSYYGDDAVMLRLGYDAEANLRRGRRLRAQERRP
jgi:hypothetical protein